MTVLLTNNARSTLLSGINALHTEIRLRAGGGNTFPTITAPGQWFPITIEDSVGSIEIMRVIARSGDVFTVKRAQEGTTAKSFSANDVVELRLTVGAMQELVNDTHTNFGRIYMTPADGVDSNIGVPAGYYFNVRSPSDDSYVDEYQNVNGVAVATGKSYPSGALTQAMSEQIDEIGSLDYLSEQLDQIAVDKGWDASFVVSADGSTQQDINDFGGAKWRNKAGGYALGATVKLDNGDIVKSTINGNANDPNVDMTGWVFDSPLLIEYFGAKKNSENSDAIQAAFDYLRSIGGGSLSTNIKKMSISKQCVYHDNTTVDFNNCKVTLTNAGQICSALYNADRSAFTGFSGAEIYYKYQASRSINNPNSRITSDANTKSQSLIVADAIGFAVGDYVLVSNGYCDMWRVMEKYDPEGLPVSRSFQDWVRPDVDLWRCEIAKIKSITGTTIVFEDCLENDYKAVPKTYGFFSDENNRADHQTWNYPFIERLGGASSCTFKNVIIDNQGSAEVAILSYCGVNNNVLGSYFKGKGQGVDFISCFNSHILNNFSDTESFGQSIRRGSNMCVLANASANYVSGDSPLIIWEGASRCTANNLNINGTGGDVNHAKIGFYFNTCWNNVASNITGKNLETVVGVMFCRGGNITTNLIGTNCAALFNSYASFDDFCNTGILQGTYKDLPSEYDSALFSIVETCNTKVENLKHRGKYSANSVTGRVHIYKSFGIELDGIDAPNIILWNSVDDDKKYDSSKFKMKTRNSVFKSGIINQSYNDGENQTRRSYLKSTDFLQDLSIANTHNTELQEVKILGRGKLKSLVLMISHFTRLIDCEIYNQATGIDFRGDGSVGSENWTSFVYMRNTVVDAPTKFLNYTDPSYQISINIVSPKSRGLRYLSVLSDYPKIKTYANPAGDGNTIGWFMVENTKNLVIESYTSTELGAANNAINVVDNKWLGREVFNTTVNKFMRARGGATTSAWISEDGTTTITPA